MPNPISSGLKQFQNLGKIQNSSQQDEIRKLHSSILSGRVSSINQEGTGNDGVISVEVLEEVGSTTSNIIPNILPLFPNQKNYPLINEVVMVVALANNSFTNNFNRLTYYYINPLNIWNSTETNPLPLPTQNVKSSSQNKGYLETQTGNPNKPDSKSNTTFTAGTYFQEKGIINPVYAFEGDSILEGRFGNSIRLGNTVPNNTAPLNNNWSITGSMGDPITILSNGLHNIIPSYNSITEDINQDNTSLYLTSTQQIPIKVSSQNSYLSYSTPPTNPNQYNGKQALLNSGRIVFNTTEDHLLLSSAKSINLNTVESVNIDAATQTVIQTPELYLGGVKTAQPVVLGDDLVGLLTDVLSDLSTLTRSLQNQIGVPMGSPLAPTNLIAQTINAKIGGYKTRLQNSLSQTTKTV
tara:strand:+ start:1729 stop:2958 length:1230 start_codon:yes stop_codon:yes gene_type:complete